MTVVNVTKPVISGTPTKGQSLACSTGTWTHTDPLQYTYQWERCDSGGASCVNITGATNATYVLVTADVGNTIRCVVTATEYTVPPVSPDWETAVSVPFAPAAFTPTRTVNVTNQSQLQSAISNLQAGDQVNCTGSFSVSGELTIQNKLSNWAQIDFGTVNFTGTGYALPAVWIKDVEKLRCYGGNVVGSDGVGILIYSSTDFTWQDFTITNCKSTGLRIQGIYRACTRIRVLGEISHCGTDYSQDPHSEKGTGLHGCYLGGATFNLVDCMVGLDVHDQPSGAAIEINQTTSTSIWLRAKRLTFAAQQQVAGNGLQFWGGAQPNNILEYVEVDQIQGHGIAALASPTDLNTNVLNFGRATNYALNPLVGNWAWDTDGGIQYTGDIDPASYGSGD